jgi:hypothetical protein
MSQHMFIEEHAQKAPVAIVAQLELVRNRVRRLAGVLRGSVDPSEIVSRHNVAEPDVAREDPEDDRDLVIAVWDDARRLRVVQQAVARAQRRRATASAKSTRTTGRRRRGRKKT